MGWFDETGDQAADERAAAAVGALADGVGRMVSMARALAESGRRVDVAGLDQHVGVLCAKALDLPPALGRAVRVQLIALREDLDALSAALQQNGPDAPCPAD